MRDRALVGQLSQRKRLLPSCLVHNKLSPAAPQSCYIGKYCLKYSTSICVRFQPSSLPLTDAGTRVGPPTPMGMPLNLARLVIPCCSGAFLVSRLPNTLAGFVHESNKSWHKETRSMRSCACCSPPHKQALLCQGVTIPGDAGMILQHIS